MQRIANYGSFLQAYALKKLLEQYGCSVEFVDYHVGEVLGQAHQQNSFARKVKKTTEAFRIGAPFSETLKYVSYKKNFSTKYSSLLGLTEKKALLILMIMKWCLLSMPASGFLKENEYWHTLKTITV